MRSALSSHDVHDLVDSSRCNHSQDWQQLFQVTSDGLKQWLLFGTVLCMGCMLLSIMHA